MTDAVLLVLIIVIPLFDLLVAVILWWSVRRATPPAPRTLVERAWLATAIWAGVSIVALVSLLRMAGFDIATGVRTLFLTLGILLPSIANLLWLVRFLTGGFGRHSDKE